MTLLSHPKKVRNEIKAKRPFCPTSALFLLILSLFIAVTGIVAADDVTPPVPDVSVPPQENPSPPPAAFVDTPSEPEMGSYMVYLPMVVNPIANPCGLNDEETAVAALAMTDPNQGRPSMTCDPILAQVARARAQDMAQRQYFGHVDPDGYGPNYKVRAAGYGLPTWYSTSIDGNNIESIAAGYATATDVWNAWLGSSGHRTHVLAESSFW
ncbi:MAG: hypothetical protein KC419_15770, partial [Anaerolineales bacterium]|nr:hypothetical protein [Anaerolineales bacterium]